MSNADIIVVDSTAYYRSNAPDGWAETGAVLSADSAEWYQAIYNYWTVDREERGSRSCDYSC